MIKMGQNQFGREDTNKSVATEQMVRLLGKDTCFTTGSRIES